MAWAVEFQDDFKIEYDMFEEEVKRELVAKALMLESLGPQLGRPHADTLRGSKHSNMKELRFDVANGVWRVAFAFDPERKAILLAGADKRGQGQKRFYGNLISLADDRYSQHLDKLKKKQDYGDSSSKSSRRISKRNTGKNKGESK